MSGGGSSSGGNDAASSPGGGSFAGLTGVTTPLTGIGTAGSPLAMPAATASSPGYMTAAQAAQIANAVGWYNRTIAKAMTRAGFASDEQIAIVSIEGHGFNYNTAGYTDAWFGVTVAGGVPDFVTTNDRGGLTRFRRSTASGTMHLQRNIGPFMEGGGATGKRWYMRARIRVTTTGMGAAAIVAFGASNDGAHGSFVDVGVVAANSTTKYSARLTGTTTVNLISTVSFDQVTCRWVELWCDGTNTFLSVEDETPVSGAYVAFTPALKPNACYILDATTGTRDLLIDRAFWAAEQAT